MFLEVHIFVQDDSGVSQEMQQVIDAMRDELSQFVAVHFGYPKGSVVTSVNDPVIPVDVDRQLAPVQITLVTDEYANSDLDEFNRVVRDWFMGQCRLYNLKHSARFTIVSPENNMVH